MATMHPLQVDNTSYNLAATNFSMEDVACFPSGMPQPTCGSVSIPGLPGGVTIPTIPSIPNITLPGGGTVGPGGFNVGDKFDADIQLTADPATVPDADTEG